MNTFPDSVNEDMVIQMCYPDDPVSSLVVHQYYTEDILMMFINSSNYIPAGDNDHSLPNKVLPDFTTTGNDPVALSLSAAGSAQCNKRKGTFVLQYSNVKELFN
jgi:hypothetical protein